MFAISDFV